MAMNNNNVERRTRDAYGGNTKRPPENAHGHPRSASGRAQSSQVGACTPTMGAYFSRITLPLKAPCRYDRGAIQTSAPHHDDASDALTIDTPLPPRSDASHSDLDSSFALTRDDQRWWRLDHDGVSLSDAPIVPNIPNLGNDAFSHNKRSLSTSSSDTGATNTIYSGNCAADP
eukprot:scaffold54471_cov25-Attheya_sp.AAC.1